MTWEIVVGLSVLFGFGVAVVTPIVKLNTTITKLNQIVESVQKDLKEVSERNTKDNDKIFAQLDNHEHRITILEVSPKNSSK